LMLTQIQLDHMAILRLAETTHPYLYKWFSEKDLLKARHLAKKHPVLEVPFDRNEDITAHGFKSWKNGHRPSLTLRY